MVKSKEKSISPMCVLCAMQMAYAISKLAARSDVVVIPFVENAPLGVTNPAYS